VVFSSTCSKREPWRINGTITFLQAGIPICHLTSGVKAQYETVNGVGNLLQSLSAPLIWYNPSEILAGWQHLGWFLAIFSLLMYGNGKFEASSKNSDTAFDWLIPISYRQQYFYHLRMFSLDFVDFYCISWKSAIFLFLINVTGCWLRKVWYKVTCAESTVKF